MKLLIPVSNAWEGSFLQEPISGDNFMTSVPFAGTGQYKGEFPRASPFTEQTAKGVIYRLVGEQRRLFQVDDNYLGFIDGKISFARENVEETKELVSLRNINKSADNPSGYAGIAGKETHPYYTNEKYSSIFLWPLVATPRELRDFILTGSYKTQSILRYSNRLHLLNGFEFLKGGADYYGNKLKLEELFSKEELEAVLTKLRTEFPNVNYKDKDVAEYGIWVTSSLYLLDRVLHPQLSDSELEIYDNGKKKWNKGIAHRGVTGKDFRESLLKKGTVIASPLKDEPHKKRNLLSKKSYTLIIDLDISEEDARKLKRMIADAAVGTFSVGKKGLAYLKEIKI